MPVAGVFSPPTLRGVAWGVDWGKCMTEPGPRKCTTAAETTRTPRGSRRHGPVTEDEAPVAGEHGDEEAILRTFGRTDVLYDRVSVAGGLELRADRRVHVLSVPVTRSQSFFTLARVSRTGPSLSMTTSANRFFCSMGIWA